MNNQGNKGIQKENEMSPENKCMEDCDLNDKEFKIAVLKKLTRYKKTQK